MTMENLMKVLMESAMQSQQQPRPQAPPQSAADPLAGVLGSLLGGGTQQGGTPQQSAGGGALGEMLGGLLGGQQGGMQQQSAGGDMLGQLVGGLLGGAAQGGVQQGGYQQNYQPSGNSGDMLLGALESIIGGQPGSGQALPLNQGSFNMGATSPVMMLLQPVVNQVAAKLNISPQIATVLVPSVATQVSLYTSRIACADTPETSARPHAAMHIHSFVFIPSTLS